MPQITATPALASTPAGASVDVKPYASPQLEWRLIGPPLENVVLPRGTYRWWVQSQGFDPIEFVRNVGDLVTPLTLDLATSGSVPAGMVALPASRSPVDITGFATENFVALEPFAIDRHDVTNGEFKQFIAAGGYSTRKYWKHAFVRDGHSLSWARRWRCSAIRAGDRVQPHGSSAITLSARPISL